MLNKVEYNGKIYDIDRDADGRISVEVTYYVSPTIKRLGRYVHRTINPNGKTAKAVLAIANQ